MREDIEGLEAQLGHSFTDRECLMRALTHKSRAYEKSAAVDDCQADNEQLEFLGDSVLGFVVSASLVRRHPTYPEGRLSKLKAHLVSAARLYEVAQALDLGTYLLLGRGEEMSGGREKKALLADAVEALIAALYLDGGIEVAGRFIEKRIVSDFSMPDGGGEVGVTDFKSALQEAAQALKLPQPRYLIVEEEGPEHAKTFTVEVRLGRELVSKAQGFSKKSAGQKAAQLILQKLPNRGSGAGADTVISS